MPKIVDHKKQKEKIAKATWSVIKKVGIEKASVRTIAEEAELSVGALRHYFKTQSELLQFTMKLASERVNERISSLTFSEDVLEDICSVLYELLPLDKERKEEMEVYFEFTKKSFVDSNIIAIRNQIYKELELGISRCIEYLIQSGKASPTLSIPLEVARLFALIDGLALHGLMNEIEEEKIKEIVKLHVQSLCK
ncbi:TetR/AcrR family transcriptional regulator [Niallia sp. 01092]|uniref:TetR/AcrR family transcriptional regulator n=1 Tax=unclassified Niallia TaxID=2837522 RepID=UPI003FD243DD